MASQVETDHNMLHFTMLDILAIRPNHIILPSAHKRTVNAKIDSNTNVLCTKIDEKSH